MSKEKQLMELATQDIIAELVDAKKNRYYRRYEYFLWFGILPEAL